MKTNSFSAGMAKGIILAILGLLLIFFPIQVVKTITIIFGVAALISGGIILYSAIIKRSKGEKSNIFPLLEGGLNVIFGLILILVPSISVTILAILVGVWVIIEGILRISASFELKKLGLESWGKSLFVGLLFLVLGILVIFHPELTKKAIVIWIGVAILVFGLVNIFIVNQIRKISNLQ